MIRILLEFSCSRTYLNINKTLTQNETVSLNTTELNTVQSEIGLWQLYSHFHPLFSLPLNISPAKGDRKKLDTLTGPPLLPEGSAFHLQQLRGSLCVFAVVFSLPHNRRAIQVISPLSPPCWGACPLDQPARPRARPVTRDPTSASAGSGGVPGSGRPGPGHASVTRDPTLTLLGHMSLIKASQAQGAPGHQRLQSVM